MKLFLCLFCALHGIVCRNNSILQNHASRMPLPLVLVKQGQLRGIVNTNWKGAKFFSFFSIPYAKKPLYDLRFKDPWPPDKWKDIWDATSDMPRCIQHNVRRQIIGREDCLYLNVHTPRLTGKAPVMVYIHGGGYLTNSGRSDQLGPDYLLTEDIVLVTFNYRLGLFGFLNFDDPKVGVPGNAGMKDQVMALKWVHRNIHKFGGDPNNVTIFGHCVGAVSVHLHMMSPLSKHLFHKAIALSGTGLHPWAMGSKDSGLAVAEALGIRERDPVSVFNILQRRSVRIIMEIQEELSLLPLFEKGLVGPVIESKHNGTTFLSESPYVILAKEKFKKCPFILGATSRPSLIYEILELKTTGVIEPPQMFDIIPYTLSLNEYTLPVVYHEIMRTYEMRELRPSTSKYRQLLDDLFMNYFLYVTVKKHAKMQHKTLYLYKFSAVTRLNYLKFSTRQTAGADGASHMDDVGYLFRNSKSAKSLPRKSNESKCINKYVKLFVNFAKTGNPTPKKKEFKVKWKKVKKSKLRYLNFHTTYLKMKNKPFRRMTFWKKIYERFGSDCVLDDMKNFNKSVKRRQKKSKKKHYGTKETDETKKTDETKETDKTTLHPSPEKNDENANEQKNIDYKQTTQELVEKREQIEDNTAKPK